jgi:hypothetical protein
MTCGAGLAMSARREKVCFRERVEKAGHPLRDRRGSVTPYKHAIAFQSGALQRAVFSLF